MKYTIMTKEGDDTSVVLLAGGKTHTMSAEHGGFKEVCRLLRAGEATEEHIMELFSPQKALDRAFKRVTERITVHSGAVHFDGDRVDNSLTQAILTFYQQQHEGDHYQPLALMMEKILTNPDKHSQENLYRWLINMEFGIAADGDIIAYKGLKPGGPGKPPTSSSSGTAWVDGVLHTGQIPNPIGAIVEMPRSKVTHDPRNACAQGLHAGTWSYAGTFTSGPYVAVKINPRDVVSVPTDCNGQKMRVCRYKVIDVLTGPLTDMLFPTKEIDVLTRSLESKAVDYSPRKAKAIAQAEKNKELGDIAAGIDKLAEKKSTTVTEPSVAPRKPRASKPKAQPVTPEETSSFYEDFKVKQFNNLTTNRLKWLCGLWEIKFTSRATKAQLVAALLKEANRRRRALAKMEGVSKAPTKPAAKPTSKKAAAKQAAAKKPAAKPTKKVPGQKFSTMRGRVVPLKSPAAKKAAKKK